MNLSMNLSTHLSRKVPIRKMPITFLVGILAAPVLAQSTAGNPAPPAPPAPLPPVPELVVAAPPQPLSTRSGDLLILDKNGAGQIACPLKHTDVNAELTGLFGRVRVRQVFHNPLQKSIEAVYVFPLPSTAAVDDMTMQIGSRRIRAQIKPREEARQIYEAARAKGQTASLLDQERPNIFTQSVANIAPGAEVVVELSYFENLKFEEGVYEWSFPTVVGPRYMPGAAVNASSPTGTGPTGNNPTGTGWSPDTTQVPDASKISPPVAPPGLRAGHDLSLQVSIRTGQSNVPIQLREIESSLHAVKIKNTPTGATVSLANKKEIPNKDFVLRFRTGSDEVRDSFLSHTDSRGRFFSLMLQPPRRVERADSVPRELVFVLDTSGSMNGFPIEKAKAVMQKAIDNLGPQDEFNLITFAGDTHLLWPEPRAATPENLKAAQEFLATRRGGGGTEMMKAINASLEGQDPERVRIVCFMTDGYVGNDMAIIDAVKKNAGTARVFGFGIGNSVNRYLLDGMSAAGRGAVDYVLLSNEAEPAAKRFFERINAPVLTDIVVDWGGLPVTDVYPKRVPDLFSSQPIVVTGRLEPNAKMTDKTSITLRGRNARGAFERPIRLHWNKGETNQVLPATWAWHKIAFLMNQNLAGLQNGSFPKELKDEITALGLDFRLMTQFTSFVAVEDKVVNIDGKPLTIAVPVEIPDGVSYEGVFGPVGGLQAEGKSISVSSPRTHFGIGSLFGGVPGPQGPVGPAGSTASGGGGARGRIHFGVGFDHRRNIVGYPEGPQNPEAKLAPPLAGLAERMAKAGPGEDYSEGKLRVVKFRVNIKIYLSAQNAETQAALEKLGFIKQWEEKGVNLLIGSLDVRQLAPLSQVESVTRIEALES